MPGIDAKTARSWALAAAKVGVSAALLLLLARRVDWPATQAILAGLRGEALIAGWALLSAQTFVMAVRWRLVLDALGTGLGYGRLLRFTYVGAFCNQFLPTSFGGDAVRAWLAHRGGVRSAAAIGGLILDRASGVIALIAMAGVGLWWLGPRLGDPVLRHMLLAVLAAAALGIACLAQLDRLPLRWRGWRVLRELAQLGADIRRVLLVPGVALPLHALSMISHGLAATTIYVFAGGLGIDLTLADCLALLPPVILVTLVPVSFAGWGVREAAMVTMLGVLGVGADAALALSVVFGLGLLGAAVPGSVLWLGARRARAASTAS